MKRVSSAFAPGCPLPVQVDTSRGAIECAIAGFGSVIVALHGGMGGYDQSWLLAKALSANLDSHRVVAVSRPGYLGTDLDRGRSPDEQADLICALLDALDVTDATLVAVSAGGPSALQFAARHPRRCRSLVLVSTCTERLETPPEIFKRLRAMETLARVPGLAALLRWRTTSKPDRAASRSIRDPEVRARTLGHPEAGPLLQALQSGVFERLRDRLPGTINDIQQLASLRDLPTAPISLPVLIVHGEADAVVPFRHADGLLRRVPEAELLAIPHGEHVSLLTHLELVRERAARYLRGES
ncbi:Pimeloyl-ACP methyl ester carboxylesterase [Enhydrobacter aerosaccus]|uniref:Pimeloyl-ACP methyl ester carboxylesterase n=1 Tax=Enhydrobacter aerosaccus TaxID=225324 RepID=A0A1T4SS99_9HYPH|nr:alpha/beta hydrolase [Enhydrobacter aerosaccus]SKA31043.1 Pimeloyl-ACP methyl ester carboxylesterase [Enhydrobacter aerosaccus]